MAQSAKKPIRALFVIVLLICMAGSALLLVQALLPGLLESKLLPVIADRFGIPEIDCRIGRIGFFGSELGPVTIGSTGTPALSVDTLRIGYQPLELFKGRVKNVRLSGVIVNCAFHDGIFSFPGLNFKPVGLKGSRKSDAGPATFPVGSIQVRSAIMALNRGNNRYQIPFELDLRPDKNSPEKIQGLLRLYPRGQQLDLAGSVNFGNKKRAAITLQGDEINLERFADIGGLIPGLGLQGKVDIRAKAGFSFSPFSTDTLNTEIIWKNPSASLPMLKIAATPFADSTAKPLKISLKKNDKNRWNLSADHCPIASPVPAKLADLEFFLDIHENRYMASGRFRSKFTEKRGLLTLTAPAKTLWDVLANVKKDGNWSAKISNKVVKSSNVFSFKAGKTSLKSNLPLLTISAAGTRHSIDARWKLSMQDLTVKNPDARLECPAFQATGRTAFSRSEKKPG